MRTISIAVAALLISWHGISLAQDRAAQQFITKAIQGNLAEVSLGKLAQDKGNGDGVRSFGQMLVTDHSSANEKAIGVAKDIGVQPPTEPSKAQKATYDKLSKLSGAAFDREFIKHMVDDHKKDIREFQAASKLKDERVRSFAQETLPTLQKHLDRAQSLASAKQAKR
jgi:putative membrane protein